MKESRTTTVLRDLTAQFQEQGVGLSRMCSVLAIQVTRLAQLQAEVDVLRGRRHLGAEQQRDLVEYLKSL
jgi:hypothetical protein